MRWDRPDGSEGPPRTREALLDHIYRRGTRLRRRRRATRTGLALLGIGALLLVVVPLGGSPSGGDERVATEDGPRATTLDRAQVPRTTVTAVRPPSGADPAARAVRPDPAPPSSATTTSTTTAPPEAPPAAEWRVSPTSGPPGTVITASGTGCTGDLVAVDLLNDTTYVGYDPGSAHQEAPVDARGAWSMTITVPDEARNVDVTDAAGTPEWRLTATCLGTPPSWLFSYEQQPTFDVTGPVFVPPRVTISPATAHPGARIQVSGDDCPAEVAKVDVFYKLDTFTSVEVPVRGGSWRTTVTVPTDIDVGWAFVFYVSCGTLFDYQPMPAGVVDIPAG